MELADLLYYSHTSPSGLRWKVSRGRVKKDEVAGSLYNTGYWVINTGGRGLCAHRVILHIIDGFDLNSELEVDHKDRNPSNNEYSNLRVLSHGKNMRNMGLRKLNLSGISGVRWDKQRGKWFTDISIHDHSTFLGRFDNLFDACCARKSKELELCN